MSVAKGAVGDHMEDGPVGGSGEGLAYLPLMTKVRLLYKVYIHSNTSVGQREKKKAQLQFQHQRQRDGFIKRGTVGLLLFQRR